MDQNRRGDWESGVDENLVALNAAQRVADRTTNDLFKKYNTLDKTVRGDPERDTDGLISRTHAVENTVNLLRAELKASKDELKRAIKALENTVNGDMAGNDGHEQRLRTLEGKRSTKEKREGYFWHFVGTAATGSVLVTGWLIMNWDRVEGVAKSVWHFVHPSSVVTKAAAKKGKHHAPKKAVVTEVHDEPASEPTPQN